MEQTAIIKELSGNRGVFKELLTGLTIEEYLWKIKPEKWCLLEIICHLYDEEREDFRARVKHVLETPTELLPSIDPPGWVNEREYLQQSFKDILKRFLKEREQSVEWLQSLQSPKWDNAYSHPKFGQMTAKMFLSNWLAHDYLHIRQILKLKFDYLRQHTGESLTYAGEW
ncbi:MAG: DinB family protein [Bacteroidia bacterium]